MRAHISVLDLLYSAPGVSVGERRQFFKLEAGGSIPLGSTRGLALTAFSVSDIAGSHGSVTLSRSAFPKRVVVQVVRFFARKAHQRES